ncbi:hypothetical protein C8J57DRAFT_1629483 [Mycena rebaudengoi]|nr:hypothetical protein C8J57DRAFT_1629483 [Mycena rebaudengoi]
MKRKVLIRYLIGVPTPLSALYSSTSCSALLSRPSSSFAPKSPGPAWVSFRAPPATPPFQTRDHFLLACQAWDALRPPHYRASIEVGSFGNLNLPTLLNDPLLLKPVAN